MLLLGGLLLFGFVLVLFAAFVAHGMILSCEALGFCPRLKPIQLGLTLIITGSRAAGIAAGSQMARLAMGRHRCPVFGLLEMEE